MKKTLSRLAAPLALSFLGACASTVSNENRMTAAVALGSQNDFRMAGACQNGQTGAAFRGGALFYSESADIYRLSMAEGDQMKIENFKAEANSGETLFTKLDKHCYPR